MVTSRPKATRLSRAIALAIAFLSFGCHLPRHASPARQVEGTVWLRQVTRSKETLCVVTTDRTNPRVVAQMERIAGPGPFRWGQRSSGPETAIRLLDPVSFGALLDRIREAGWDRLPKAPPPSGGEPPEGTSMVVIMEGPVIHAVDRASLGSAAHLETYRQVQQTIVRVLLGGHHFQLKDGTN